MQKPYTIRAIVQPNYQVLHLNNQIELTNEAGETVTLFSQYLLTNSEKRLLADRLKMAQIVALREKKPMTVNLEIRGF
jgi:hypothetical protein